jgi:hypothetical protein
VHDPINKYIYIEKIKLLEMGHYFEVHLKLSVTRLLHIMFQELLYVSLFSGTPLFEKTFIIKNTFRNCTTNGE